jgi:hypothetical protein
MSKIVQFPNRVKPGSTFRPTTFVLVVFERHQLGRPDEFLFLPVCSACGEVIEDLESACIEGPGDLPVPAGKVGDIPIGRVPGAVFTFHAECCPGDDQFVIWKRLNTIVRSDQRYEFEKHHVLE